jgi:hypothetical protein
MSDSDVSEEPTQQLGSRQTPARKQTPAEEADVLRQALIGMYQPSGTTAVGQILATAGINTVKEPYIIETQTIFKSFPITTATNYAVIWLPWYGVGDHGLVLMRQIAQGTTTGLALNGIFAPVASEPLFPTTLVSPVVGTFITTLFLPTDDSIEVSPPLRSTFNRARCLAARLSIYSTGTDKDANFTSGILNWGAPSDVRDILTASASTLVQQSLAKKDGQTGVPIQRGGTTILGTDIRHDMAPVDPTITSGEEESGVSRNINTAWPNGMPFRPLTFDTAGGGGANAHNIDPVNMPGRFENSVFFSPFMQLSNLGAVATFNNIPTPDIGFTQMPQFELEIQVPATFVGKIGTQNTVATAFIGSSANLFAPLGVIDVVHLWASFSSSGTLQIESVRESRVITTSMCNDSCAFTNVIGNTPGFTDTTQYNTIRWKTSALRPIRATSGFKSVWVGTFVSPQGLNSDDVQLTQQFTATTPGTIDHNNANIPLGLRSGPGAFGPKVLDQININAASGNFLIRRIDMIAVNLYRRGVLTPVRMCTIVNAGVGQNVTIKGEVTVQAVTGGTLTPFVHADLIRSLDTKMMTRLDSLFSDPDNSMFKRWYVGYPSEGGASYGSHMDEHTEWYKMEQFVKDFTRVQDLLSGSLRSDVANVLRASGLFGSLVKKGKEAASALVRRALPRIIDTVIPQATSVAQQAAQQAVSHLSSQLTNRLQQQLNTMKDQASPASASGMFGDPYNAAGMFGANSAAGMFGADSAAGMFGADSAAGMFGDVYNAAGSYGADISDDDDFVDNRASAAGSFGATLASRVLPAAARGVSEFIRSMTSTGDFGSHLSADASGIWGNNEKFIRGGDIGMMRNYRGVVINRPQWSRLVNYSRRIWPLTYDMIYKSWLYLFIMNNNISFTKRVVDDEFQCGSYVGPCWIHLTTNTLSQFHENAIAKLQSARIHVEDDTSDSSLDVARVNRVFVNCRIWKGLIVLTHEWTAYLDDVKKFRSLYYKDFVGTPPIDPTQLTKQEQKLLREAEFRQGKHGVTNARQALQSQTMGAKKLLIEKCLQRYTQSVKQSGKLNVDTNGLANDPPQKEKLTELRDDPDPSNGLGTRKRKTLGEQGRWDKKYGHLVDDKYMVNYGMYGKGKVPPPPPPPETSKKHRFEPAAAVPPPSSYNIKTEIDEDDAGGGAVPLSVLQRQRSRMQ